MNTASKSSTGLSKSSISSKQPDRAKFNADVESAENDLKSITARLEELATQIEEAKSNTSSAEDELKAKLESVQNKLKGLVGDHTAIREKIKLIEAKINQQRQQTAGLPGNQDFKSTQELDAEVERLQKDIDGGKMRLVEERQAQDRIRFLNMARSGIAQLEDLVHQVSILKESLHKGDDSPEVKELRSQERTISADLAKATKQRQARQKKTDELQAERKKLQSEQWTKRSEIRKLKDEFYASNRDYQAYLEEIQKSRQERYKAERAVQDLEEKLSDAKAILADSALPANHEKIVAAKSLIRVLNPSAIEKEEDNGPLGVSKLKVGSPQPLRTVSGVEIKGRKIVKKDVTDEWYMGTGGSKSKSKGGNRRGAASGGSNVSATVAGAGGSNPKTSHATSSSAGYNLDIGVIQQFAKLDINPPTAHSEVPGVVSVLKEKIEWWRKTQEEQAKETVEKTKKEITTLEQKLAMAKDNLAKIVSGAKKGNDMKVTSAGVDENTPSSSSETVSSKSPAVAA